jgi:hypothetical protein
MRIAWNWSWARVLEIAAHRVSHRADLDSAGLAVVLLILVIVGSGLRLNRRLRSAWPFLIALALYLLLPEHFHRIAIIHPRLDIFVACFALLLGVGPSAPGPRRWVRLRIALAVAVLLGIQLWRSHGFATEIRGFDEVVERIPSEAQICMSPDQRGSAFYSGMAFSHFDSWVATRKRVALDTSFALLPHMVIRFHPDQKIKFGFSKCEFFLAHSSAENFKDLERSSGFARLESRARGSLGLAARSGSWYLLQRESAPPSVPRAPSHF